MRRGSQAAWPTDCKNFMQPGFHLRANFKFRTDDQGNSALGQFMKAGRGSSRAVCGKQQISPLEKGSSCGGESELQRPGMRRWSKESGRTFPGSGKWAYGRSRTSCLFPGEGGDMTHGRLFVESGASRRTMASAFWGHPERQAPSPSQKLSETTFALPSTMAMAPSAQSRTHWPQPSQRSASISMMSRN